MSRHLLPRSLHFTVLFAESKTLNTVTIHFTHVKMMSSRFTLDRYRLAGTNQNVIGGGGYKTGNSLPLN